jgi:23S rRNA pseudouridine955/2504/2580 synthase
MKQGSSGRGGAKGGRPGAGKGFRDGPARPPAKGGRAKPAIGRSRSGDAARASGPARPKADARPPRERAPAPAKPRAAAADRPQADAPRTPTRAEARAATTEVLATGVQTLVVDADEADMRVDRFLNARFPQLAFTHIQRIVRKGELRVDGKRAQPNDRLQAGQKVRIPPLKLDQPKLVARSTAREQSDREFLKSITLYEDKDVLIINKPMGLAVQGGSGTTRHVDGLLESLQDEDGQRARLVHRLDKDTAGCLVIAKTRFAASTMAKSFRSRTTRKIYWALVAGVPRVRQGRISTFLAKEGEEGDARMRVAQHGDEGASHALTYYAVIDNSAQKLAWLSLKPVTGRTHQLRRTRPISAIRSSATRNISTSRTGSCPAASRTACICWPGGSSSRTRAPASPST